MNFPAEVARQIDRVLRLQRGESVIVLDGSGDEYEVRLDEVGRATTGTIAGRCRNTAEPAVSLSLFAGMLKGAKLELVLQRCTEIGVSRFVPVESARAVRGEPGAARRQRFEAIVREAAEQCGRGRLPEIAAPVFLQEALAEAAAQGPIVFLWEGEATARLSDLRLTPEGGVASLFVGPEGGFSAEEAEAARRAGAHIVTLGRRILRAETAAIVGSALLLAGLGDL